MITDDSRFNYTTRMRVVDDAGFLVENERVHLPYPREPIITTVRPDVVDYTVKAGDTWSNVAARFFRGRSDLWWVIAEFTGVVDPFDEFVVGKTLKIPQFDTVMFEVLNFDKEAVRGGLSQIDSV